MAEIIDALESRSGPKAKVARKCSEPGVHPGGGNNFIHAMRPASGFESAGQMV